MRWPDYIDIASSEAIRIYLSPAVNRLLETKAVATADLVANFLQPFTAEILELGSNALLVVELPSTLCTDRQYLVTLQSS
jgi:hypothetical protein